MTATLDPPVADLDRPPVDPPPAPVDELALHARGVTVRFGGLTAVDDVAIDIAQDEVVGLIGGNGAGKTTFMNVVSGYVEPEAGAVLQVRGRDLIGLSPEYRPYVDVGRSYQAATLFAGLTVTETLLVAVERHHPTPLLGAIVGSGRARRIEREKRERVAELVETCGLGVYAERLIRELSTGTRRVVDLACILAQQPRLLLLDEPTGGLAQRETEAFAPLIKRVQRELGCAVMVIEHDMVMIGELCDRVYAMETGRVIASGTPDEVRNDPLVIASYLGTDETAIARSGTMAPAPAPQPVATSAPAPATAPPVRPPRRSRRAPPEAPPSLEGMTRAQLLEVAADAGIVGRHRMRKDELVESIIGHRITPRAGAAVSLSATGRFEDQLAALLDVAEEIRRGSRREGDDLHPLGPKATRTRLSIIAAGVEVFCEQGYGSSSVGDVHERAGVSLGTFYQYFRDKADLVATIVAEAVVASAHSIWPTFDPSLGHRGVSDVIDGFVRHYASTADFQRVWEEVTQLEPTAADLRIRLSQLLETSLSAGIAAGQDEGSIDPALDPALSARALAAMVDRTCFLTFVLDRREPAATEEVTQTLTQLWTNVLQLQPR